MIGGSALIGNLLRSFVESSMFTTCDSFPIYEERIWLTQ
jgi:hypothetical protein